MGGLGVVDMVVLDTRERVHDLGVHKALGMTQGQTITVVIASVVVAGLIDVALGAPIGVLVQQLILGERAGPPVSPCCPPLGRPHRTAAALRTGT